jgi:hypothetical protein
LDYLGAVILMKAAVLAKFMMLGIVVGIGERYKDCRLSGPTRYRAFAFLLSLVALTIVVKIVVGWLHHRSIAASPGEIAGSRF